MIFSGVACLSENQLFLLGRGIPGASILLTERTLSGDRPRDFSLPLRSSGLRFEMTGDRLFIMLSLSDLYSREASLLHLASIRLRDFSLRTDNVYSF